jgi:hypothetical protein
MKYQIWVNTILSTTIEASSREEAIEKALELSDMRIEEVK